MKKLFNIFAVAAITFFASSASNAVIMTYSDRTTWTTDAGTVDYLVDFETFASDTSFASSPLDVGPFTLSANGASPLSTNKIDVTPFTYGDIPASNGNAYASIFVEGTLTVDLTFDVATQAFFADFGNAGNTSPLGLQLNYAGGGSETIFVPGIGDNSYVPFGFISTGDAISSIRFFNSLNDGFYLDNVSSASPVPEPETIALLGLGLVGYVVTRRKRAI